MSEISDYPAGRAPDVFAKIEDARRPRALDTCLCPVLGYRGGRALVDGREAYGRREVVVLCSADYLGLAHHPDVIRAAVDATESFGVSVNSVPLMAGSTSVHRDLQDALARFTGMEAAVLFQTGYAANTGVIAALCSAGDVVVLDGLVHPSILDGVRLSGARRARFRHSDAAHLAHVLADARAKHPAAGILVVVEGVYGIDGDLAPLPDLIEASRRVGARVMVDDAHATGVIGATGRGSIEHFGGAARPDVIMGSLSKALGSAGGWIACSAPLADYLRSAARTIVLSVGLPTACAAAARASLDLLERDLGPLARLRENAAHFKEGLAGFGRGSVQRSQSAIVSIEIGDEARLRDVNRDLFLRGVWAEALPFPLVPKGQSRIRFRISALHEKEDLRHAIDAITEVLHVHGIPRADRV